MTLPLAPAAVSVNAAGTHAAVGHDGWISFVDLRSGALLDSYSVSVDALDVVLDGQSYVYVFPRGSQWTGITALNLDTGATTTSGGWSVHGGTLAKLHPNGTKMYGAENGISPSDIERYDLDGGQVTVAYDSPYHGDYAMCGNLWFSEDGARIFTACGNTFRSSDVRADDMTYAGRLEGYQSYVRVVHLDHSGAAGRVAAIPQDSSYYATGDERRSLRLFGDRFLDLQRTTTFPMVEGNDALFPTYGKFVFFDSTGTRVWAVSEADASSGLLENQAIVAFELD